MKTEVVEISEKQTLYISEDGLVKSKYPSEVEDYENKLALVADLDKVKVRCLSKDAINALRCVDICYGYVMADVYKVGSFEEFKLLVHQLEELYNVKAFRGDIDEYSGYTTISF